MVIAGPWRMFDSHVASGSDREIGFAPNEGQVVVCASKVSPLSVALVKRGSIPVESVSRSYFSCATTGEGLFEGLQWLSQNVKGTKA
jgi:hypothetical protein